MGMGRECAGKKEGWRTGMTVGLPLFPVFSYFSSIFWKDPLHGNRREGGVSEAGQKRVNTCLGLFLFLGAL